MRRLKTLDAEARPSSTPLGRARAPLPALGERNYRLLLLGDGLSHLGDMLEHVARGWLVFELTDSPFALGLTAFSAGFPRLLLGLMAGVLADRLDRRKILFFCASGGLVVQALFATLVLLGAIQVWQVLAIVLVTGILHTLNQVTRNAMIPDTVSRANLPNAIGLFTTTRGTLQILAPSLAGLLIVVIGVAGILYLNVASFLAMLVALGRMRIPPAPVPKEKLGFREDIGRGVQYVWSRRDLLTLILLGLIPVVLVLPYRTLMPVFARDVLGVGAPGYGVLMAAPGIGGVLSAAAVTVLNPRRRGLLMLGSLLTVSLALLSFAGSPWFISAFLSLVLVGMSFNVYRIMNNTVLQELTPREMMGRVLGIYHTDKGLQPLGALMVGTLASLAGAPLAVGLSAGACLVMSVALLALRPSVRRL